MNQFEINQLRSNPALVDWPESELTVLADAVTTERYQQGAVLAREGRPGACCWLVLEGQLEIVRSISGHRMEIARANLGDLVGQLSLVDGSPRSASVIAATDVQVLVMTRDVFNSLLASHAPVALRFQRQVAITGARQLRRASEQLAAVLGTARRKGKLEPTDLYTVRTRRASTVASGRLIALVPGSLPANADTLPEGQSGGFGPDQGPAEDTDPAKVVVS